MATPAYNDLWELRGTVDIYEINETFVKPWTRGTGSSVALLMNSRQPLQAKLMVSHSWRGEIEEVKEALEDFWDDHDLPSSLPIWFCLLSNYQAGNENSMRK